MFNLVANYQSASGGAFELLGADQVYEYDGYEVHVFTSSGTLEVVGSGDVEYMIVAGGGGTQYSYTRGGGGGGQVIHNFTSPSSISSGMYSITVGLGGNGAVNGENSIFNNIQANGGGGGIFYNGGSSGSGNNGGSGYSEFGTDDDVCGGGAGQTQNGGNAVRWTRSGNGGNGINLSTYVGTSIGQGGWFAGGGRGNCGVNRYTGSNGNGRGANTGGGAQGRRYTTSSDSNGNSGIVVIRKAL